jgi:hypothetical protein
MQALCVILLALCVILEENARIDRSKGIMIEEEDGPSGKAKGGHARAERLPPERRSEIAKQAAEARWKAEPLPLVEDAETGDRFVLYTTPNGMEFRLRFEGEEPWATQQQIAELFGVSRSMATRHVNALFKDGELDEEATCSFFEHVGDTGQRYRTKTYNLDVILGVGYRVQATKQAIIFRQWANQILRQYLMNGFVIDVPRLEHPDGRPDHFEELLSKVRHIRASEKRMWTRVLELSSFCSDYGLMTDEDRVNFFATIQNAMHWTVTQKTAAEVIYCRVDANRDNAGVVTFSGEMPTVAEAQVAKNFYGPAEIKALNLVTSLTLEFFESQAEQRRPTTIAQFLGKVRELLKLDGRPVIRENNRGSVSMSEAKRKASVEIKAFKERIRLEREITGEKALQQLAERVKRRKKQ